jgi:rhodanese-related sulfurtransferase
MAKKHSPGFLQIVTDARSRISEITIEDFRKKVGPPADALIIDVREDHEFQKGHLKDAIHLGKGIIERDIETVAPDVEREIILYCGGGYRSALAVDNLQKMGYRNVHSLAGGFSAIEAAGLPLDSD